MCKTDNYILRITNTSLSEDLIVVDNLLGTVSLRIPLILLSKGKCRVTVIDSAISLRNASGADRVVTNDTHIIALRSNISSLGFNSETGGNANILGSAIIPADTTNVVSLDSQNPLSFVCMQLPAIILIERMCYDSSSPFKLIRANNYTTATVPFQVTLSINFFEDMV